MNPDNPVLRDKAKEIMIDQITHVYKLPTAALPGEMLDFIKIIKMGAEKYALNNWLNQDGTKTSEKDMHDSMFHHLAESMVEGKNANEMHENLRDFVVDKESGMDPLLHLACRALMLYTRRQRGLVHPEDRK